jgi:hypothetical protein
MNMRTRTRTRRRMQQQKKREAVDHKEPKDCPQDMAFSHQAESKASLSHSSEED